MFLYGNSNRTSKVSWISASEISCIRKRPIFLRIFLRHVIMSRVIFLQPPVLSRLHRHELVGLVIVHPVYWYCILCTSHVGCLPNCTFWTFGELQGSDRRAGAQNPEQAGVFSYLSNTASALQTWLLPYHFRLKPFLIKLIKSKALKRWHKRPLMPSPSLF